MNSPPPKKKAARPGRRNAADDAAFDLKTQAYAKALADLTEANNLKRPALEQAIANEEAKYASKRAAYDAAVSKANTALSAKQVAYAKEYAAAKTIAAKDGQRRRTRKPQQYEAEIAALKAAFAEEAPARDARIQALRDAYTNRRQTTQPRERSCVPSTTANRVKFDRLEALGRRTPVQGRLQQGPEAQEAYAKEAPARDTRLAAPQDAYTKSQADYSLKRAELGGRSRQAVADYKASNRGSPHPIRPDGSR